MSRDFTITAISSSNAQHDKSGPYIPLILSVPGVSSLRIAQPYTEKKG